MKLIFERSVDGRNAFELSPSGAPRHELKVNRQEKARLPEVAEIDVVRHYTELSKHAYGVDNGFYPLGSCTMKYNPKVNEVVAGYEGFNNVHPSVSYLEAQGSVEVIRLLSDKLCGITGMDCMTLQPAAGAHGEFTGIMLIKAYHKDRGDDKRTKIIVPDSAHGTNPASANMCGFTVVSCPSNSEGGVDIDELRKLVGDDTAGLMLTNPNTLGLFDKNILKITDIVHKAGGLCYYDGANLNAIMGVTRPGDMGFDVMHLNIHKTFSTPHGGGGPGSGPVGCKNFLASFLPVPVLCNLPDDYDASKTIGKVKSYFGNFPVYLKGLAYIMTLGAKGLKNASQLAVLNANYLLKKLKGDYDVAYDRICMHEFVLSLENIKRDTGATALDVAKTMIDYGIHPPTMYFPLIVHEALMFEPTETESIETLDAVAKIMHEIRLRTVSEGADLHASPTTAQIGRVDEVTAARNPILKYDFCAK